MQNRRYLSIYVEFVLKTPRLPLPQRMCNVLFKRGSCRGNASYFAHFKSNVFAVACISDAIVAFKRKVFAPNISISRLTVVARPRRSSMHARLLAHATTTVSYLHGWQL